MTALRYDLLGVVILLSYYFFIILFFSSLLLLTWKLAGDLGPALYYHTPLIEPEALVLSGRRVFAPILTLMFGRRDGTVMHEDETR